MSLDYQQNCLKTGDIVLIRKLPEKKTTLITHSVEKVIYKLGDVIDPITNKPVVNDTYRDVIEEKNRLYGTNWGYSQGVVCTKVW